MISSALMILMILFCVPYAGTAVAERLSKRDQTLTRPSLAVISYLALGGIMTYWTVEGISNVTMKEAILSFCLNLVVGGLILLGMGFSLYVYSGSSAWMERLAETMTATTPRLVVFLILNVAGALGHFMLTGYVYILHRYIF